MNRVSTQRSFLGVASARFPFTGESWCVSSCRFHSCRHLTLLLVALGSLPARQQIFSIGSYLQALETMLGFYPRCAQIQPAKKKLRLRRPRRFSQSYLGRRQKCKGVRFSCERARASPRPRSQGRRSRKPAPRCVGGSRRAGQRVSIRFTAASTPCANVWGR